VVASATGLAVVVLADIEVPLSANQLAVEEL
jgi:hypothetical protein